MKNRTTEQAQKHRDYMKEYKSVEIYNSLYIFCLNSFPTSY